MKNVDPPLLYPKGGIVTTEKRKDMMDVLIFIPYVNHNYYINLTTGRNDDVSHTPDDESIIYITD